MKPIIVFTTILEWMSAIFCSYNCNTAYADIIPLRHLTGRDIFTMKKNLNACGSVFLWLLIDLI